MALDRIADRGRENTPIDNVDRSNSTRLFNLKHFHFPREWAEALGSFMKRWKRSNWMRQQVGYREKAALAASSRGKLDGPRLCYCRPGRLCGQVHYCPRCKLEKEIRPALAEYADVFCQAPFWFAAVPSITYRPEEAGLHYIVRKDAQGRAKEYRHRLPFSRHQPLPGLTLDMADFHSVEKLLRVPFEFAKRMERRGLSDGAHVTREIALDFVPRPEPIPKYEWRVVEVVLPHGNGLFNTRRKPCWRFALECWQIFLEVWDDWGLMKYGYPDLMVGKPMVDQAEINRWIGYELKPLQFGKFYRSGIKNGCCLEHLNLQFDQTVFGGVKEAFNGVRSPRKYGNLNGDPRSNAHEVPPFRKYIGIKPPNRTAERIRAKIRKSLKQSPPGDLFEKLSEGDLQFLIKHHLDGKTVTIEDLNRAEPEL